MLVKYHSLEGRHDGPHLLITAGVHGDEWEPIVAVQELLSSIDVTKLHGVLTCVPVANESAYEIGQRFGADGLDLARVCPGREDGTVTERAAFELAELMRRAEFFVDLHTGGLQLRIWPLAGYMLHLDERVLTQQRSMARAFGLPFIWGTDPSANGRTLSLARDLYIPAIYVEYLGSNSFCNDAVRALVAGCRSVMNSLGMIACEDLSGGRRFVAEEHESGSGHLQVRHPAPYSGIFEPIVELGAKTRKGAPFGYLYADDSAVENKVPICADRDGRIVALRTLARVNVADALGVVVYVEEI